MTLRNMYQKRHLITGFLVYGSGDLVASLLTHDFSFGRVLGMSCVGALWYGLEIPHYFRWLDQRSARPFIIPDAVLRPLLATLYFNPLWVARHLMLIMLFSGDGENISWDIFDTAVQLFLNAMPLALVANVVIQNVVPLSQRFLASALFSCFMAVFYPLVFHVISGA